MTNQTEALAELRAHCLAAIEHVGSHNSAEREREAKQAVRDRFSEVIAALRPPAPSEADTEAERVAFEAWAISEGFKVERGSHGLYTSLGTNHQFSGWLARASLTGTAS